VSFYRRTAIVTGAPVVAPDLRLAVTEGQAYRAIADRPNLDPDRYPPQYAGCMVWNCRASKTGDGKHNHPRDWVWSPIPTHEPLVTLDLFTKRA
jgi:hypothetical protein